MAAGYMALFSLPRREWGWGKGVGGGWVFAVVDGGVAVGW